MYKAVLFLCVTPTTPPASMLTQMQMLRVLTWVKMLGGHMTNTIAQKIFWLKLTLCFIGLSLGVGICLGEKIFPAI